MRLWRLPFASRSKGWPESLNAFWKHWNKQIEAMEAPQCENVANDLLFNYKLPVDFRVFIPWRRHIIGESLSPHIRQSYGLETTE